MGPLAFQAQGYGVRVPGLRLGGDEVLNLHAGLALGVLIGPALTGDDDEEVGPGREGAQKVEGRVYFFLLYFTPRFWE